MPGSQFDQHLICLEDPAEHFRSYFNQATGHYLRTGILDEQGADTGVEPFRASFPQLLDVGIMGHCAYGLSGLCDHTGFTCYQDGTHVSQPNMKLEDFISIARQCQGRVFQFALGGRGDPELHEDFEAILAAAREWGIVPNLTTSGWLLTRDKAVLIKKYCGAAAVSWYGKPHTQRAIDLLLNEGVTTNIHVVLSESTIDQTLNLIQGRAFPEGINRVVFLLYKPAGRKQAGVLKPDNPRVAEFFRLIDQPGNIAYVGFDSCCVPALVNNCRNIDPACYDACEAARFSAYIAPDMHMAPCSFDQRGRWAVNLRAYSIREAWESPVFESFRNRLRNSCTGCPKQDLCLGGCPIRPEIVLCARRQAYHH
jgi:radical SAM protein with 4Fe4S-binding SPASM domain